MTTNIQLKQLISDTLNDLFKQMPYNEQSQTDPVLAEHYMLKTLASNVNPRLDKIEKKIKEAVKSEQSDGDVISDNYHQSIGYGTPRNLFDQDTFIAEVSKQFNIPRHKLVEIAGNSKKLGATPISVIIEYKGDDD